MLTRPMLNIRILFTNYNMITDFLNLAFFSEHFISIKHRTLATFNINKKINSDSLCAFKYNKTQETLLLRRNTITYVLSTDQQRGPGGSMSQVVGSNSSYKPITNTAWVGAQLCKLQQRCTRLAAASDKVYQLLAHGRWFSPGTPPLKLVTMIQLKYY